MRYGLMVLMLLLFNQDNFAVHRTLAHYQGFVNQVAWYVTLIPHPLFISPKLKNAF